MRKNWLVLICSIVCLAGMAFADEGMWLFNVPPTAKIKAKYNFQVTQPWLDHVRLSSVRFNNGGSGSFVSPDGLTFTNHHVGQRCLYGLSTKDKDLYKTGFYAATRADEAKCPDLELNVLMGIEDVTEKIAAAAKPATAVAEQWAAQRAAMSAVENDCATATKLRCDVVTLYSGAMYHLYKYKKYTDVRVVFAPEFDIAFFGGDPDNFEYPRHDLDITFFRVYENGQPAHLDNYFKWSQVGVKEGELVFISGNPGSTDRLDTMAQMEFLRDVQYPANVEYLARRIKLLEEFSAKSPENSRIATQNLFSFQNSLKANQGSLAGLRDQALMADKESHERKMRQAVANDPQQKTKFGDPWANIANAEAVYRRIYWPLTMLERRTGGTRLTGLARTLVRAAAERQKPNGERLREFRESNLPSVEQGLFAGTPVYKSLDVLLLTDWLQEATQRLADNTAVQKIVGGKSPAQAAASMIEGTKLDDPAVRKQLYEGGAAAIQASTDPLIVMMRDLDPDARKYRKQFEDEVDSVQRRDGGTIARIRFAQEGTATYPDATFTLRLGYGEVKGYVEDGRGIVPKGTKLPYFTTFGGAFDEAAKHGDKTPFVLPPSWVKAKAKLNLNTPFNVIDTTDTIGGNSGSPVVNRAAEVVGIIFDGNIQSLPWRFQYEDRVGRSVHVSSRGILEALRTVYGATALANELTGGAPAKAAAQAAPITRKRNGKAAEKKEKAQPK